MDNRYRLHTAMQASCLPHASAVRIAGFVVVVRRLSRSIFLDVEDASGRVHCLIDKADDLAYQVSAPPRRGDVVSIEGAIERNEVDAPIVRVRALTTLSQAEAPARIAYRPGQAPKDHDLQFRYHWLRDSRAKASLLALARLIETMRNAFLSAGFVGVETPLLVPVGDIGARDFLCLTRAHPGKVFALRQGSQPQLQLALLGGFDKVFEISTLFRDEDGRSFRDPAEFRVASFEIAFIELNELMNAVDELIAAVAEANVLPARIAKSAARYTHEEALALFGTTEPDVRHALRLRPLAEMEVQTALVLPARARDASAAVCTEALGGAACVVIEADTALAQRMLAQSPDLARDWAIHGGAGARLLAFDCHPRHAPNRHPRNWYGLNRLAERLDLLDPEVLAFAWVYRPPHFMRRADGGLDFTHTPYAQPQGGFKGVLGCDPDALLSEQCTLICNGMECGKGDLRVHEVECLQAVLDLSGMARETQRALHRPMLEALSFGAPPHGGFSLGVQSLARIAFGGDIRQFSAFPKSLKKRDLMLDFPRALPTKTCAAFGVTPVGNNL